MLRLKRSISGFTIIEMIVVMVIIVILSATFLPRFFKTTHFTGRFFYDEVLGSIRYAQKYAITSQCNIQVAYTATTLTLKQRDVNSSGQCNDITKGFNTAVPDPASTAATNYIKTAPPNINITIGSVGTASDWPIYFNALGEARLVSNNTLSNYSLSISGHEIHIIGATGYVSDPLS